MKIIALTAAAALTMGSAAYAYQPADNDRLIPLPSTSNTENYDGPNSRGAPGQPAPTDADARLTSPAGTYSATARTEYPFCSATVRDNCRQRRDPGY
ncbi:MAG: hypothetical protein HKN78_13135 [Sphingomonadaceae bacterium]|nr:hypothetical protein [Sphingomonadaceae bacterium]